MKQNLENCIVGLITYKDVIFRITMAQIKEK